MNNYDILGVKKSASDEEIKVAYRDLMKRYHPDLYQGDKTYAEKRTKEINAAYDILSNKEKRAEYDLSLQPNNQQYNQYGSTQYGNAQQYGQAYQNIYNEYVKREAERQKERQTRRRNKLYRRRDGRVLAGVCGGFADYFGIDASLVRLLFVLFGLTNTGIFIYLILATIIPLEPLD